MQKDGRLKGPLHIQFVKGVKNAMPVYKAVFDFYVETVKRIAPDASSCGTILRKTQPPGGFVASGPRNPAITVAALIFTGLFSLRE